MNKLYSHQQNLIGYSSNGINTSDSSKLLVEVRKKSFNLAIEEASKKLDVLGIDESERGDYFGSIAVKYWPNALELHDDRLAYFKNSNIKWKYKPTNCSDFFFGVKCSKLDVSSLDTSNVTDMNQMFQCSVIDELDISCLDTSKVRDMSNMFYRCHINKLNMQGCVLNNVETFESTFEDSDIGTLNMQNCRGTGHFYDVADCSTAEMFRNCTIGEVNMNDFDGTYINNFKSMFYNSNIETLNIQSFEMDFEHFEPDSYEEYDSYGDYNYNIDEIENTFNFSENGIQHINISNAGFHSILDHPKDTLMNIFCYEGNIEKFKNVCNISDTYRPRVARLVDNPTLD